MGLLGTPSTQHKPGTGGLLASYTPAQSDLLHTTSQAPVNFSAINTGEPAALSLPTIGPSHPQPITNQTTTPQTISAPPPPSPTPAPKFTNNPIQDNAGPIVAQALSTLAPGIPAIATAIKTGNWQPYVDLLKEHSVDIQKLASADPAIHGPEMAKIQGIVLGATGGELENVSSKSAFSLSADVIRRGEEIAHSLKRPEFTDPTALLKFIDTEGSGSVGVFLTGNEKQLLGDYLSSINTPENTALRGAIVGPARPAYGEANDLVLGKVNDYFVVVADKGFGAGKVRIHRTPMAISKDIVLGHADPNSFLALPPKASTTPALNEPTVPNQAPTDTPRLTADAPPAAPPEIPGTGELQAGTPSSPQSYGQNLGNALKEAWTNTVEYFQNSQERVRKLVNNPDMKVTESTDPYLASTLYHGRVGAKIESAYQKAEEIAQDVTAHAGSIGLKTEDARVSLNSYLQALHAPERNAALGDGAAGMTNEAAKTITDAAHPEIKAIAQKALDLNKQSLGLLHSSGVISDDLFQTLTTKYPNHVPLQRVMEQTDDLAGALTGRGFDVKSSGLKKATGSDLQVQDIIGNIINNHEQAVLRSEKNIVDQATLAFVRENKNALDGLMTVQKPKSIGTSHEGIPLMEKTTDPNTLQMFENGKPVWIKIADPKLATALRGVGREKLGGLLNAVASFTRVYSSLATRFNPEFAAPNKIRDLQETITYLAAQDDMRASGTLKTLAGDPASAKAVLDHILGRNTEGAKLYQEMKQAGGTTGGMGLSTRVQTQLNVDKIFSLAESKPRQAVQRLVGAVDSWNTLFEDSTRLSVYKGAIAQGLSKERAAFLAKEASINFNRSGNGGPVINALYMFSNASIQGSAKMIVAMRNPKVAAGVSTAIAGSVAAVSEWNNKIDPDWRDKVSKTDRLNGLPIMLPSAEGARYFIIPVSWGLKPLLVMANHAYDAFDGKGAGPKQIANDIFSAIANGYNPIGGTDIASAITPTIGDVPVEIARNQSWTGSKIRPDSDPNAPRDIQYFQSLGQTEQGKLAINATKELKDTTGMLVSPADLNYVIDQYVGGAGRSIEKTANTLWGFSTGSPPPPSEYPFLSRFYREKTAEQVGQGAGGVVEDIKSQLSDQSRARFTLKQEAQDTFDQMKAMPKAEAASKFETLAKTNPDLADKIKSIAQDDKLGLSYSERLIKELGTTDGERARYIVKKLSETTGNDAKAKLWEDYQTKKLITPEVANQIQYLLKNP